MQNITILGDFKNWLRGCLALALCLGVLTSAQANPGALEAVNINTADAVTLAEALVGVGLHRAQAIVAYRDEHGKFQDVYELVAVKGIGEATVAQNEERIRVSD